MDIRVVQDGSRVTADDHPHIGPIATMCPKTLRHDSGGATVAFTGIALVGDTMVISLPKGQDISSVTASPERFRGTVLLLMRSMVKYKAENPLMAAKDAAMDGNLGSQKIYYALKILDDYVSNGLVSRFRTVTAVASGGNVNWQKTVSRSSPLHSSSGVLYQNPYVRMRVVDSRDTLRLIQAHVVKECVKTFGWLFAIEDATELQNAALNWSENELLAALAREKTSTFSQRELILIDLLTAYLSDRSSDRGDQQVALFGSLDFENIWERACQVAFNHDPTLYSSLVPQPVWHVACEFANAPSRTDPSQRPDILTICDSVLLVLDAKYYKAKIALPGWHDIVKQIYYQDTIERRLNHDEPLRDRYGIAATANAFLLPGDAFGLARGFGHVNIPELDDGNRWGYVDAYIVDVTACLEAYVKNSPRWDWIGPIGVNRRLLKR